MKSEKPLTKFGQAMYDMCDKWGMFLVKHMWLYWVLSFTWAIITTIMGLVVSLVLLIAGKKPHKYHNVWYFEVGKGWGGVEMGICFIIGEDCHDCSAHEFGHIMAQTTLLGPLVIPVMIASCARYWYREFKYYKKGKYPETGYDDIWFERSATQTGEKCVKYLDNICKVKEVQKEMKKMAEYRKQHGIEYESLDVPYVPVYETPHEYKMECGENGCKVEDLIEIDLSNVGNTLAVHAVSKKKSGGEE